MNNHPKSISENVLDKIKKGEIKMRPKLYFILKMILLTLGVIIFFLLTFSLVSFIVFTLRANGVWFLPGFGLPGIRAFFVSLPWILILIVLPLILILELLAKKFAFVYRRPIVYSILAIIVVVIIGGFFINRTQFHPALFREAQKGGLPVVGKFYRDFGMPRFRNVHHGLVSEMTDNGFLLETPKGEVLTVIVASDTRFPFNEDIKENDIVVVLGDRDDHTVRAFGVRKVDDEFDILPQRRGPAPSPMPGRPSK